MKTRTLWFALCVLIFTSSANAQSWTAIVSAIQDIGTTNTSAAVFTVTFTNGQQAIKEDFIVRGGTSLEDMVRVKIDQLKAIDATVASYKVGDAVSPAAIDAAPAAAVAAVDLGRQAFAELLRTLQRLQNAVSLGVKSADDPDVAAAIKAVRDAYKPEYLDLF